MCSNGISQRLLSRTQKIPPAFPAAETRCGTMTHHKWGISTSPRKQWVPRWKVTVVAWDGCTLPFFNGFNGRSFFFPSEGGRAKWYINFHCDYTHNHQHQTDFWSQHWVQIKLQNSTDVATKRFQLQEQTSGLQLDALNLAWRESRRILSYGTITKWGDDCVLEVTPGHFVRDPDGFPNQFPSLSDQRLHSIEMSKQNKRLRHSKATLLVCCEQDGRNVGTHWRSWQRLNADVSSVLMRRNNVRAISTAQTIKGRGMTACQSVESGTTVSK